MDCTPAKRFARKSHLQLYDSVLSTVGQLFADSLKSLAEQATGDDREVHLSPDDRARLFFLLFNGRMTEMVRQDETRREPGNLQGRQAQLEPSCHNVNWSPQTQERWQVNHSSPCQPGMSGTGGRWGLRMVPKPTLQGRGPSARAKMFGEIFRRSLQANPLFSRTNCAQ